MDDSLPSIKPSASAVDRERSSIYRILDANSNRAREGLRVVEDVLRFAREDSTLSRCCKSLRHDLTDVLGRLATSEHCLASRSTSSDVGVHHRTEQEYYRESLHQVACVNLGRVAEALRTLEEVSKTVSGDSAASLEKLRYRVYSLAKAIEHVRRGQAMLSDRLLYVLTDLKYGIGEEFERRVRAMLAGGVGVIQLRDKNCSDRELIRAARVLKAITLERDALLIINDRPDIARVVAADGVHVGQCEMDISDVRAIVGPDMCIGVSTHSLDQARTACFAGSDYIGVGPVFPSKTKSFHEFAGLPLVRSVCREIDQPVFPIGGIDAGNIAHVVSNGACRVAVGHAVWHAADPSAAAQALCHSLNLSQHRSS